MAIQRTASRAGLRRRERKRRERASTLKGSPSVAKAYAGALPTAGLSSVAQGTPDSTSRRGGIRMGLDDMLKGQLRERLGDLKPRLVQEFSELTDDDVNEAGNDPDRIVDKIQ